MAVIGGSTPQVAVAVPVPTPVQKKPKPKAPAAVTPTVPEDDQPQPQFTPPPRPRKDNWNAVILPWTPTPKRLSRLQERPIKMAAPIRVAYPHESAHQTLTRLLGQGGRGTPNSRNLGRTHRVERLPNGDMQLVLHRTPVVTAHRNGQVTLNHGGWMSRTTARYMAGFAGPHVRNVSFRGGEFQILGPNGWQRYENNTPFPPEQAPQTEEGQLSSEALHTLHQDGQHTLDTTTLGVVGDMLAEQGHPRAGAVLSRYAERDPGADAHFYHPVHPMNENYGQGLTTPGSFRYTPPHRGEDGTRDGLHRLSVRMPDGRLFHALFGGDMPERMQRRRIVIRRS